MGEQVIGKKVVFKQKLAKREGKEALSRQTTQKVSRIVNRAIKIFKVRKEFVSIIKLYISKNKGHVKYLKKV